MNDQPKNPLDDMWYLDGYLNFIYTSDMPDGAWWAALESTIEEHWPGSDGFETLHSYLKWKAKNDPNVTMEQADAT